MARIPMQMVYEVGACTEDLGGTFQVQAYAAMEEAFGRPIAFQRGEVITYLEQRLGWPRNRGHNAYAYLLAQGLLQEAEAPMESYHNPFRENVHAIECTCTNCTKELEPCN